MSIPTKELKALLQKSGNRCAFPGCGEILLHEGDEEANEQVVLSKIAHIVAESPDGPRGKSHLSTDERNQESNLLVLCGKHHDVIDNTPQLYTVERLRQIKEDHETLIRNATGAAISKENTDKTQTQYLHESIFSTLFSVIRMPVYVYSAQTEFTQDQKDEIGKKIVRPKRASIIYPYIIRSQRLFAFQDLRGTENPFSEVVNRETVEIHPTRSWWDDPAYSRYFVDLLNRSLNKLTGHKGLRLDRDHHRYYFEPDEQGKPKEVSYRPLNVSSTTKQVAWQPISKKSGKPKTYWLHRAVGLRFHRVASTQWCLSIRPEFRVTKDGYVPIDSEKIGARVTSKKSRMFNYDLLGEVNFWRYFLSGGEPRIIMDFGSGSSVIISTTMMQTEIDWPGIPEQYAKPFRNVEYAEDLFSWAKLQELSIDSADEIGEYVEDGLNGEEITENEDDEYYEE